MSSRRVNYYLLGQSQRGFHGVKFHQYCWHGKERERWSFIKYEENFITIKSIWHSYLVFSLDNCGMKLCTETGLKKVCIFTLLNVWLPVHQLASSRFALSMQISRISSQGIQDYRVPLLILKKMCTFRMWFLSYWH